MTGAGRPGSTGAGAVPTAEEAGDVHRALLRGVLLVLIFERPSHGYELAERLRAVGIDMLESYVYRALQRLEDEGCIEATWDTPRYGRARRVYDITPAGEDRLEAWVAGLAELEALISECSRRFRAARRARSRRQRLIAGLVGDDVG